MHVLDYLNDGVFKFKGYDKTAVLLSFWCTDPCGSFTRINVIGYSRKGCVDYRSI
jgi:hypothetical protein